MLTYIAAFIFYTLAMIGVLLTGFVIYKKAILPSKAENKGMIKVLDRTNISPKKSLLVVKVKNEKFLIALDAERTTFLSKLADDKHNTKEEKISQQPQMAQQPQQKQYYTDNLHQQRLDRIQKQFKQLYSSNQEEQKPEQVDRKEMIRKLLKELNDTTGAVKTGSY